jgi:mono/diheme cytochrome c family protein
MRFRTHLPVCWLLVLAPFCGHAQDDIPAGARSGRGSGGTRDFLGLGAPPDPAAAARGEKIYTANCAFCHGEKARGASAPNLVRSAIVLHDEKGETIGALVSKGVPEKGMPAFAALTEGQLYDVAQYLHMQVELVANRGLYKRLNIVTGDAKAGEAYFNGAGGCAACHSITGDLAHVASKYAPDALQNRFVWPGGRGGVRGRKVTVTLSSGEKIPATLKQLDDVEVSVYDSTGRYRSWPRDQVKLDLEDTLAAHRALLEKYSDAEMHNLTAYLVTLK